MTDALEDTNRRFHAAYAKRREAAAKTAVVLVVLAPELTLCTLGKRAVYSFARDSFDAARSAAHLCVSLFVGHEASASRVGQALTQVTEREDDELMRATASLLRDCVSEEPGAQLSASFFRRCGERVLRLTELASDEQLGALHQAVEQALADLDPARHDDLQVVVAGDHQARRRSLGMQYFARRLPKERVMYGENITSVDEALTLVGTRILDREIAHAFFGDATRLQEDILGAATEASLADFSLAPIGSK